MRVSFQKVRWFPLLATMAVAAIFPGYGKGPRGISEKPTRIIYPADDGGDIAEMTFEGAKAALLRAKMICNEHVGPGGVTTDNYSAYTWLMAHGSDEQLIELTNNSNPYTRTYAFMALCGRKYEDIKTILEKNIKDKTVIETLNGCFGSYAYLNDFWLTQSHKLLSVAAYKRLSKKAGCGKGSREGINLVYWL